MKRRDFLLMTAAAAFVPARRAPAPMVLYDDRSIALDRLQPDPKKTKGVLWVHRRDLPRINDFELKPQGACRADLCVPVTKDMMRGEYFSLTRFAERVGQSVVADLDSQVWSFGEIPARCAAGS